MSFIFFSGLVAVGLIENSSTLETNEQKVIASDGLGGVLWKINPVGLFFEDDLILDGTEIANRFIYVGGTNVDLTLPLESTVSSDYAIIIDNRASNPNRNVTIVASGGDTIVDNVPVEFGDMFILQRTGVGEYTLITISPAAQSALSSLNDSDIGLDTTNNGKYVGISVEDALEEIFDRVVATEASHTGEVVGSTSLTVDPTSISNKALDSASSGMELLVNDAGTLKKVDAGDFLGGINTFLLSFSKNANLASGIFLINGEVTTSETHGPLAPADCTLETITVARTDVDAADIEVLSAGVVIATVASSAAAVVATSVGAACLQGDTVSVRNKAGSSTMSNVIVTLLFEVAA